MQRNVEEFSWDDTSLVDNWNAKVEEYKKYHQNGKEQDSEEPQPKKIKVASEEADQTQPSNLHKDTQTPEDAGIEAESVFNGSNDTSKLNNTNIPINNIQNQEQSLPSAPSTALTLDGLDQDTKNLVMAWYWAGYYQGLHEGRKRRHI